MRRHGMTAAGAVGGRPSGCRGGRLEGVALHLPLASGRHLAEVERLLTDVVAAELPTRTVWVSHLTAAELATLRSSYADLTVRPRIGTDLWLGDREALRVTATVLDVHELERGDAFGYRGRSAPRDGHLLVVSGGTAHGIGLEAPTGEHRPQGPRRDRGPRRPGRRRASTRSPFWVDGKQRLFAEPPHMQASMLFLPAGAAVPGGRRPRRRPGALHRDDVRPRRRQLRRLGAHDRLAQSRWSVCSRVKRTSSGAIALTVRRLRRRVGRPRRSAGSSTSRTTIATR